MIRAEIARRLSGELPADFTARGIRFHLLDTGSGRLLLSDGIREIGMTPPSAHWDADALYAEFAVLCGRSAAVDEHHPAALAIRSFGDRMASGEWLGYGHLLPDPSRTYPALTLYPLPDENDADIVLPCPDGRAVTLWLVVPLTPELLDFRLSADGAALWKRLAGLSAFPGWPG